LAKFVRGAQGPVWLAQKFARHENRAGLPGVDDVFGLPRKSLRSTRLVSVPDRASWSHAKIDELIRQILACRSRRSSNPLRTPLA